jgi:hypothetical protein
MGIFVDRIGGSPFDVVEGILMMSLSDPKYETASLYFGSLKLIKEIND